MDAGKITYSYGLLRIIYGGCGTVAGSAFDMRWIRSRCGGCGLFAVVTDSVEGKIRFFRADIINLIFLYHKCHSHAIN